MRALFIFSIVVLLASCKTHNLFVQTKDAQQKSKKSDITFLYDKEYEHTIRRDDKVTVSVWGQDELSVGSIYGIYNSNEVYGKWMLVDRLGNIELPKYGTFKVEGYKISILKDTLENIYRKWIVNPIVDVKVLNKEITVLGEVRNPSVVPVDKDQNTLLEMISRTGGFEFYANLKKIKVLRQAGDHVHVANIDLTNSGGYLAKNIQLHPGDIIIVPSKSYKTFDKRISTIIPFTSTATAAAILLGAF
jgi:polysaccharide biosynthesis/export protein